AAHGASVAADRRSRPAPADATEPVGWSTRRRWPPKRGVVHAASAAGEAPIALRGASPWATAHPHGGGQRVALATLAAKPVACPPYGNSLPLWSAACWCCDGQACCSDRLRTGPGYATAL